MATMAGARFASYRLVYEDSIKWTKVVLKRLTANNRNQIKSYHSELYKVNFCLEKFFWFEFNQKLFSSDKNIFRNKNEKFFRLEILSVQTKEFSKKIRV